MLTKDVLTDAPGVFGEFRGIHFRSDPLGKASGGEIVNNERALKWKYRNPDACVRAVFERSQTRTVRNECHVFQNNSQSQRELSQLTYRRGSKFKLVKRKFSWISEMEEQLVDLWQQYKCVD